MIPEGWDLPQLKELVQSGRKISYGIVQPGEFEENGIVLIRGKDYSRGWVLLDEFYRVSEIIDRPYRRSKVKSGDILLTIVGEYTGNTAIVPHWLENANITQTTARIAIDSDKADAGFVFQSLSGYPGKRQVYHYKKGGAQPGLNIGDVERFRLPMPLLFEQKKIAGILSTWDDAIETTKKLIVNAEAQKRALMQQLLTGKRRLKAFEREWERRRIGDLLKEVRRPVDWSDDDTYRLVSIRRRSGGAFLREELPGSAILTKNMKTTRSGDFLISKMQVVHGAMAMTPSGLDGCHISGSYISLVPRKLGAVFVPFFDWLSRTREMYRCAYLSSYGVHIEKMTFNLDWFFAQQISLPPTLEEQEAIVELLDSADAICVRTKAQMAMLQTEKKALMQQLLTGKRRVAL